MIEFEMDALEFGITDYNDGSVVRITIDTEEKAAWLVCYVPNHPDPYFRNYNNYPIEEMDFKEALELYEEYLKD